MRSFIKKAQFPPMIKWRDSRPKRRSLRTAKPKRGENYEEKSQLKEVSFSGNFSESPLEKRIL
jgi:hypothetical protein